MIKEDKNVDFLTTGRQPSEEDFTRISEWIKENKQKNATRKKGVQLARRSTSPNMPFAKSGAGS